MKRTALVLLVILSVALLWGQPEEEELLFWDFQDTLEPEYVNWYIVDVTDIEPDTSTTIEFMDGTDGNNSRIGYVADTLWTTDQGFDPNSPPDKYIQYTFRPRWNYVVHLTTMEFRLGRNNMGPNAVVGQFSFDGFEDHASDPFWIAQQINSDNPNSLDFFDIDFGGAGLRFAGPDFKMTIRLYPIAAVEDEWDYIDPDDEDTWPTLMMNNFRVNGFIVPIPAIAIALDRTGSMGDENFGLGHWDSALSTAQNFVENVMIDLDALSVVSYAVDDPEDDIHAEVEWEMYDENAGKLSQLWFERTQNPDSTVYRPDILDEMDDIDDPDGRTSIGSALYVAGNELYDAYGRKPGKAAIMLMSDGWDNWYPMARHVLEGINNHPDQPYAIDDSISVYTITFGGQADIPLMQRIAQVSGGVWANSPDTETLGQIYGHLYFAGIEQLQQSYFAQQSLAAGQRDWHEVLVDDQAGKIKFLMQTHSLRSEGRDIDVDFRLISPSGREITPLTAENNLGIDYRESFASAKYEIFKPEPGLWRLSVEANRLPDERLYDVSAWGNSNIELKVDHWAHPHVVTGEPIDIELTLKDRSGPISGASISAEVTKPEDDHRNRNYFDVSGTPFADYEPERTISRRIEGRRNDEPVRIDFNEIEPGLYRATFTETDVVGAHDVRIHAELENQDYDFRRQSLHFFIVKPPERVPVPQLAAPSDGSTGHETDVLLVWSDVLDADYYTVQFANQQEILFLDNTEDNNYLVEDLDYDTDYFWRVKAVRGDEESFWTGVWGFTTGIPEVPVPHGLQGSVETDGVQLNWEPLDGEHHFFGDLIRYQIYRNDQHHANSTDTRYLDRFVSGGTNYTYHLRAVYGQDQWLSDPSEPIEIIFTGIEDETEIPSVTAITGNYPNPFNPETTIQLSLHESSYTEVAVYNIAGRKVRTILSDHLEAGRHTVVWDSFDDSGNPATSGVYLIKMETDSYSGHRKVILLK